VDAASRSGTDARRIQRENVHALTDPHWFATATNADNGIRFSNSVSRLPDKQLKIGDEKYRTSISTTFVRMFIVIRSQYLVRTWKNTLVLKTDVVTLLSLNETFVKIPFTLFLESIIVYHVLNKQKRLAIALD